VHNAFHLQVAHTVGKEATSEPKTQHLAIVTTFLPDTVVKGSARREKNMPG
jgi:hypothetical protein